MGGHTVLKRLHSSATSAHSSTPDNNPAGPASVDTVTLVDNPMPVDTAIPLDNDIPNSAAPAPPVTTSRLSPIPNLSRIPGFVFQVSEEAKEGEDNKEARQSPAVDAEKVRALLWRSYEISATNESRPPRGLTDALVDLQNTLHFLQEYGEQTAQRQAEGLRVPRMSNFEMLQRYRRKLVSYMSQFETPVGVVIGEAIVQLGVLALLEQCTAPGASRESYPKKHSGENPSTDFVSGLGSRSKDLQGGGMNQPSLFQLAPFELMAQIQPLVPKLYSNIHSIFFHLVFVCVWIYKFRR